MDHAATGQRATQPTFGQLLKRLRDAADLTQEGLAEQAGVSARLVSDLERGVILRPRRDTVRMLADGLGLAGPEREAFVAIARGQSPPGPQAASPGAQGAPRRSFLPLPPTPLVDRLKETAAITGLLRGSGAPPARLVTLTGPGGVGKTRLALEVGARCLDAFPDGVFFIELASVRDPALVLPAIATAVGARVDGSESIRERLVGFLAGKRLLVVLDNVEQVTGSPAGAPAGAAPAIADLLAACPRLAVLATSRERLHLRVEQEYAVAPLRLPDLRQLPPTAELAAVPAVDLFVQRAEAANRGFALTAKNAAAIAEIVRRLDGLPLAIELAAARAKILPPAALLARLEHRLPLLTGGAFDQPARLQTMRDAIAWSYDLLDDAEQALFRRLAVFAGGFSLEAAEWVVGDGSWVMGDDGFPTPNTQLPTPAVLNSLTALVDKSLLRVLDGDDDDPQSQPRFGMLETIREYGHERLVAAGEEDAARERHARWCLDFAERAEPELTGADQRRWFGRLEIEHDNLRAALGWAVERGQGHLALGLGGALYRFWVTAGHFEEARRWLESALALDGEAPALRAKALLGAEVVAFFQGNYERAAAYGEEALVIFVTLDDAGGIASSYGNLGLVADAQGDYDRARALYEEALRRFRRLDDRSHVTFMLGNLGLIAYFQADYDRATALLEEAVALARARGDRNSVAISLGNLGLVAYEQGDFGRATDLQRESLALRRTLSNQSHLARSFENVALIAAATGDPARAARLFGAAEALRARIGAQLQPNDREHHAPRIAEARASLGADAFAAAWAAGESLSLEEAIEDALGEPLGLRSGE